VILPILESLDSGLRLGSRLTEYDLEPLRETELSDLRTDGVFQAPIMNFFSFFSGRMKKGGKAKGNDNFPTWLLPRKERYITYELFFLKASEILSEIN
jgi:hypothetical protein